MNIIETNLKFSELTERNKTNRIILHHSGVAVLQSIETIHNYHKNSLGWAGIGYHFYVRKNGEIYRGRPENAVGAHAYGSNTDSIGVCFEGDFNQEAMTETQKRSGQELVIYLKQKYGINKVQAHKDVCATSCPGSNFPFAEIVNCKDEEEQKIKTVKVKTSLILREKPTTKSRAIADFINNTTVIVLEENCAETDGYVWDKVQVRVMPQYVGYMANKYLK